MRLLQRRRWVLKDGEVAVGDCTFSRSALRAWNPLRRVMSAMAMPDSPSLPLRLQRGGAGCVDGLLDRATPRLFPPPFSPELPAPTRYTRCTALWTPALQPPWGLPSCGGSDDPQTAAGASQAASGRWDHLQLACHSHLRLHSLRWLPLCRAVVRRQTVRVSPEGIRQGPPDPRAYLYIPHSL